MAWTLGKTSDWFLFGPPSGVRLVDPGKRELPGPRWVRLAPLASGICGSDLSLLTLDGSTVLEPFTSFPAILGHETVARVVECGSAVTRVKAGDRVVIDPT